MTSLSAGKVSVPVRPDPGPGTRRMVMPREIHFLSLLGELKQLITNSSYGWNNLQALEAAHRLTGRMRSRPEAAAPFVWEKIGCLENWLSILYFQRRHVP